MLLSSKNALITGASQGIGEAIARAFAQNGAETLFLLSRNAEKLNAVKQSIEAETRTKVEVYPCDMRNRHEIKETISAIKQGKHKIDILVNNAGVMLEGILRMAKPEAVEEMFETNVYGPIYLTQIATSSMVTNRKGSIINISSIIGTQGNAGNSVYSASKSAIIGFTKSLSKEMAALNIRVNAIAPGFIATDMVANVNAKYIETIGMQRLGTPEEVANLAVFLGSDLSAYITGQVIGVDGGMII
jgi:3-oxoacyl-[acyl-carrier protein] reductase